MLSDAFLVVFGHVVAAVVLGSLFFRGYTIARPPLGVLALGDVVVMLVGIILVPYLYVLLPRWCVAALLTLAAISVLPATFKPVVGSRRLAWGVTLTLLLIDMFLGIWTSPGDRAFLLTNNLLLVFMAIGIANLWMQSGMRAQNLALLSTGLMVYDVVATTLLGATDRLFQRLWGLPLAPLISWPLEDGRWLGIGLGDVLLATVFPLGMRKAFGRSAGLTALMMCLAVPGGMLLALELGIVRVTLPVMAVLGPMMALHYGCLRWHGPERTTWQYWAAEPTRSTTR